MKKLVIGTGADWPINKANYAKEDIEAIGLDILPAFEPDIVRDLKRGLPFNDNEFDEVEIHHVLEHIQMNEDYIFVMNEIWRVLKPKGIANIEVPYWRDDCAVESAEHVRFFTDNSFINFYANPHWEKMGYPKFSDMTKCDLYESGRSGVNPARCLRVHLVK